MSSIRLEKATGKEPVSNKIPSEEEKTDSQRTSASDIHGSGVQKKKNRKILKENLHEFQRKAQEL